MSASKARSERQREGAIAALMASPSVACAAERIGVSEATLRRWLSDPAFAEVYRTARRQAMNHAIVSVQGAATAAVETLRAIMEDLGAPFASRVSAARTVLDTAIKAHELEDLAERIELIEAALELQGKVVDGVG